ncbi:MAG: COX15/CtaA family protein [Oxalobacteraceae bacterium]|jgi:cytochrome c oxidase assembly protein subunit 15|nr:COX15/CtaA family protein [Oxalobacteraceae bacterium]
MLIGLALKGLLVALIPATLVYLSRGTDRYRKLAWVMVFFTFDLIVFGAFTRLTDSGLGCPDWPGCYGEANPFLAHEDISAAQAAMPTGPVTVFKAWIEMIHRYLAMGVGVLIIAALVIAWRLSRASSELRYSPKLPALLLLFVCIQGAFGAWTVTLKLQPVIVTIHLLLGMSLLSLLTWHAMRQSPPPVVAGDAHTMRWPALLSLSILFVQIALGGWVSTNYSALACGGFPLCQGSLMPEMEWAQGFTLWRPLGMTSSNEYLPFGALVAIHWAHRYFAIFVVGLVAWTSHRARKIEGLRSVSRAISWVILAQLATGISTVLLDWPLSIAVLHNAGAAILLILLVMLNYLIVFSTKNTDIPHSVYTLPA